MKYRLSRYWNLVAYKIIHLGFWMIWDQTGANQKMLKNDTEAMKCCEDVLCDRSI